MSREVRRVPADWEHPRREDGRYQPQHEQLYVEAADLWLVEAWAWAAGKHEDQQKYDTAGEHQYFWEWAGGPPDPEFYRQRAWGPGEAVGWQMYETCSEGTPISPVLGSSEELARWLADNEASAFADMTATYEQWLATVKRGSAIGMIVSDEYGFESGVEAQERMDE